MKKDILTGAAAGFFIGILLLLIIPNVIGAIPPIYQLAEVLAITALSSLGIAIARWIGKRIPTIEQLAKFAVVGVLNTLVDLGALNLLIGISGIASGASFSAFKGISFSVAVANSYIWNARWTFSRPEEKIRAKKPQKEIAQFLAISVIGLIINITIASLVVNGVPRPSYITPEQWANIGALLATVIALLWNFLGYKFIVFKSTALRNTTH